MSPVRKYNDPSFSFLTNFATGAYLYRRSEKVLQDQNRGKALKGLPPVQINIGEKLMKETTGCVSLER